MRKMLVVIFLSLIAISIDVKSAEPKSVDVRIRLIVGRLETHFSIRCEKQVCTLERKRGADTTSRSIEREDEKYYLGEIAKLPKGEKTCERQSILISGVDSGPIEGCLAKGAKGSDAFLKFIRGLDAAL